MQSLIVKINRLLTPKRMKYPWFIGASLWAGWFISLLAGRGNFDRFGHLFAPDFVQFYTAGKLVLMGRSQELYNLDLAYSHQALYGGKPLDFILYIYPPHFALLTAPFALIPYFWAALIWIALGLFSLWLSLKLLGAESPIRSFFLALTWLPVFYAAGFGQNSFFNLALFSLTYFLWVRKRFLSAGLIYSLLLFKPQFLIGIGILWLLDWRRSWKALLGLSIGIFAQLGLSLWLLPEASLTYISYALRILPQMIKIEGFPMWHAYSVQAFWLALLPGLGWIAQTLYLVCTLIGLYYFFLFWKKNSKDQSIMYAVAVIWLLWSIPFILDYDWTLLLIPVILLWTREPKYRALWKASFSFLWIVTLFSSSLTYFQLKFLPLAIQISIPAFFIVLVVSYRALMRASITKDKPDGLVPLYLSPQQEIPRHHDKN